MIDIPLLECYIDYLYDDNKLISKEIQGPNIPIEHDNRPNWIRECMLEEHAREKINCLRRLKEMTTMNPFYQYRIDRFIDAITQTYEPTRKPGYAPDLSNHHSGAFSDIIDESTHQKKFIVMPSILLAYRLYQRFFTEAGKKCKGLPSDAKSICIDTHKIRGLKKSISALKQLNSKCSKEKVPPKCKASIQTKIKKHQSKIKALEVHKKKYV